MNAILPFLSAAHKTTVDRFVTAGQSDARIVAAFLGGSYASGAADAHSDLDLYLITTDAAYERFLAEREAFVRQLGDPLFLEDWGTPHCYFFILADGTEGELWIGRESHFQHIHGGAHTVLLDKTGILTGVTFPQHEADPTEQVEILRGLFTNFWHEYAHFRKALAREQIWFAYGSLETMRHICVNLARLRYNFADTGAGEEPFFKVEQAMPVEQLALLQATFCPLELAALRQAGEIVLQFYRDVAMAMAQTHALPYPAGLERVMLAQPTEARRSLPIRPVEAADAAEWLRLRLALWPDDPEKEAAEIAAFLAAAPRPVLPECHAVFVCPRPEGGLCGLVEVSIHTTAPGCDTHRIGYLEAWHVDPDWRRCGVGRALAEQAEAWARAEGCREMASDTTPGYPLSPAAHAALGYQEVERYFRKELF